ncbi:MAG: SPOR domain-containing protein [Candidatus Omnitrophica bacterium]|nr:SPOR domain-containing protein [Candidatus Omnitrophota bacterium]
MTDNMDDDKYQRELFEFEKPKKVFPRLGNIFPKDNFMLVLTMEKLIFVLIAIIMLIVIVYALGVEMGKADVLRRLYSQRQGGQDTDKIALRASGTPKEAPDTTASLKAAVPATASIQKAPSKDKQVREALNPYYTIIAVTFTREDTASAEAARLKKDGLDAFIAQSDKYYTVCVGRYAAKEVARKSLGKVRRMYKDAYIKLK